MAIISEIGRRSLKVRLLFFTIFTLLITGSITMLYPFALMIAGSSKSDVDTAESRLIPRFLVNEEVLWTKHVEGVFNESLEMMRQTYFNDALAFKEVSLPARANERMVKAWQDFLDETDLPHYIYTIGYTQTPASRGGWPHNLRAIKAELSRRFHGDMAELNRTFGTEFSGWNYFFITPENYLLRREKTDKTPRALALIKFKAGRPIGERYYFSTEGFYRHYLMTQYRGSDSKEPRIAEYNRKHGTSYASYDQVHLDCRFPAGPGRTDEERSDWEQFVRGILNLLWVRADAEGAPAYRRFLKAKYGNIEALNHNYSSSYISFDDIPIIQEPLVEGLASSDWDAFVEGWKDPDTGNLYILPVENIRIHSIDFLFRDHLRSKYGSIEQLNTALGTSHAAWLDILPPQRDAHYLAFKERIGWLRWEFATRNYITVINYLVFHGRGMLNTVIYCTLAVLAALLVNPLAAYALSRYKPPSAYKILLFLMLTMAFPPMVTQIPVFLMMRQFHLLNTFGALILPGLANGYSIFLLKGFFDSLPKELYESASLDGAGEWTIFWQFTMSLSKPILAVIALGAFTGAYGNFMYALLICQDQKMWTLMVWLYNLQAGSGQGVIFASLIIAAIPTFLIFAFCQNIIMRGIVVPVEK